MSKVDPVIMSIALVIAVTFTWISCNPTIEYVGIGQYKASSVGTLYIELDDVRLIIADQQAGALYDVREHKHVTVTPDTTRGPTEGPTVKRPRTIEVRLAVNVNVQNVADTAVGEKE